MSTDISNSYLKQFKSSLLAGIDEIVKAAKIYVKAIDEDPSNQKLFMDEFKDTIPLAAWYGFEAVGRGAMHPKLLLGGGRNSNKIKQLPFSIQKQIFDGYKFDLLLPDGDSMKVNLLEVSPLQAEQLVNNNNIRSLGEQRAYLEEQKKQITVTEIELPYYICKGKIHFRENCVLTKKELAYVLKGM